jgi:hypothetical protein
VDITGWIVGQQLTRDVEHVAAEVQLDGEFGVAAHVEQQLTSGVERRTARSGKSRSGSDIADQLSNEVHDLIDCIADTARPWKHFDELCPSRRWSGHQRRALRHRLEVAHPLMESSQLSISGDLISELLRLILRQTTFDKVE